MNKIKELKTRLRYNQKSGYILTGKDIKTILDYIEENNTANTNNVSVLKFEMTANDMIDIDQQTLLDVSDTNDELLILSVTASLVGTPMTGGGDINIYLGETSTPIPMFTGAPCDMNPDNYYLFRSTTLTGFSDINRQKISFYNNSVPSGGDTDTLLTIYITYARYAN